MMCKINNQYFHRWRYTEFFPYNLSKSFTNRWPLLYSCHWKTSAASPD